MWSLNKVNNDMYVFERLSDQFIFGKYKGYSFSDVVEFDKSYIYWCLDLFPEKFIIYDEVINELMILYPSFKISPIMENTRVLYLNEYLQKTNALYIADHDSEDEEFTEEVLDTYERYNGSYAQDIEGCSDQFIDDVLDGDPNAYWNID